LYKAAVKSIQKSRLLIVAAIVHYLCKRDEHNRFSLNYLRRWCWQKIWYWN